MLVDEICSSKVLHGEDAIKRSEPCRSHLTDTWLLSPETVAD